MWERPRKAPRQPGVEELLSECSDAANTCNAKSSIMADSLTHLPDDDNARRGGVRPATS
jgi:hypothetical protein